MKKFILLAGCLYVQAAATLPAADAFAPHSRELDRLRQKVAEHPRELADQKKLAVYCLRNHLEDEAVTAAEACVALAPDDREVNELYVTALARAGKYQEATNAWTANLGEAPAQTRRVMDAAVLAQQADVFLKQADASGQTPGAGGTNLAPPVSPNDPLGVAGPGTAEDDYHSAADLLEKAVALDPDNLSIRLTLGWIYLDKFHDPHKAYHQVAVVAAHHPGDVNARKLFGLACLQTGQPEQAVREFRAASQLAPDDPWVKVQLGKSLARTGRYHQADELYSQVLAADPTNFDARLGQAELLAWEGRSAAPLQKLDELLGENPMNVDALVLRGNVHSWDWDLTDARRDYDSALTSSPSNYEARQGLQRTAEMGDPSLELDGYQFTDTAGFRREYAELGGRVPLADQLYLLADGAGWRFTQANFTNVDRIDGSAGLEFHAARWFEITGEADTFTYHDRDTFVGGHGSAKLTIAPGYDVYAAGAYRQPFMSSIATVVTNLKQDSVGGGLDFRLIGPLSVQDSLQLARLTDGNNWWEDKPQLSWCVYEAWGVYLRAQYDYLTYKTSEPTYFSPQHWRALGPVVDVNIPVWSPLFIVADVQAPYVFNESKFGDQITAGPELKISPHFDLKAAYVQSAVPGDQGQWSGHGWQASATIRF